MWWAFKAEICLQGEAIALVEAPTREQALAAADADEFNDLRWDDLDIASLDVDLDSIEEE